MAQHGGDFLIADVLQLLPFTLNISFALVPVIARLDRAIQSVMEMKNDVGMWIPRSRRGMTDFWFV